MVSELPDEVRTTRRGPIEKIEEIPTVGDYYNGELKLNVLRVNCKIYANPTDCLHHSNCGII